MRYEVVPADSLVPASGELQPRDRAGRASSDAQVAQIAGQLDPARLMRSAEADRGAPIVGPDHVIESGNGRVQAIIRAAEQHPERYAEYAQALRDAGFDVPADGTHILIARRTDELSPEDRQAFVREANQSSTARLSAPEQARADAANLTANLLSRFDHNQDVLHGANRDFVREWVGTLPEAERNAVLDANGALSAEGVRRLHGALLARAYDDPGVLARGLESTDDAARAVSGGLTDAAGGWAKLRARIEAGEIPPEFDTSRQLVDATERVRQARERRQSMNDILSQQDAFNPLDPVTERYVRALYNAQGTRAAARPAIADFLRRYADEAQKQTNEPGLFGAAERVTPTEALDALLRRRTPETTEPAQGNLLGQQKRKNGQTGANPPTPEPTGGPAPAIDRAALTAERAKLQTMAGNVVSAMMQTKGKAERARLNTRALEYERRLQEIDRLLRGDTEPPAEAAESRALPELATADAGAPVENRIPPGATRPQIGTGRPEHDFNRGTSPYREVFRDAGRDPDTMVSRPLAEQVQVIRRQVQRTFGFRDVVIDRRQDLKEVRDQLSNFYRNAKEMSHALGMPYEAIGLNGRVEFLTRRYWQQNQALGTYYPRNRAIEIPGRSNSFAHEWTHALDHYLSEALSNNPRAMRLLSMREPILRNDPTPGTPVEAFVHVLRTMFGGDAPTAAEALRLQIDVRSGDPRVVAAARARLAQIESQFAQGAKSVQGGMRYWATPHEMLARAHEAYVADRIVRQGGDTRGVVKPDYRARDAADQLNRFYPQQGERDAIFQAFDELHDRLRAETLLGQGVGARPGTLDIVDPSVWSRMVDHPRDPIMTQFRNSYGSTRNFINAVRRRAGFNDAAADPGNLNWRTRAADVGRATFGSIRGVGEAIVHRQTTPTARSALQNIMDLLSPAEGIRDARQAASRTIGTTYEEQVRAHGRSTVNALTNIFDRYGLDWENLTGTQAMLRDVQTEKLMLRHVLTEGDSQFTMPDGTVRQIPQNIREAGGQIRFLMDREWERNRAVGIDIGYARSGYFPRLYDDHAIYGNRPGFERDAARLHSLLFDRDVSTPDELSAAWRRLGEDVRGQEPQLGTEMDALRRNLREQDRIRNDPNQAARLAQLEQEAADMRDALHDQVRDVYARAAASDWWLRINTGDATDFDTRGPSAAYTRARELPPEADQIMRAWMVNDPTVALPRYLQQSARRIAWNERFGQGGAHLENLLHQASNAGTRGEDIAMMRRLVETVAGRQKSGLPSATERGLNTIHALGSIALMPRAAWSSLAEPVAALARTGSIRVVGRALAYQLGDILRTADSRERAAIANALGITVSHLHDAIINDRTDAHYRDSPGLSRLMTNYYARTGLTQLTNSQRRSTMAAGHLALDAWSRDLLGQDTRRARDAAAQFRDLGIADADHEGLANWITAHPGLPNLVDLETDGGRLWGQAITRLTDQIIQDPHRVDKPLMSQNPVGRLMYGLMSFNYSFYHNIVERTLQTHEARIREGYQDARAAGAGRVAALGGTAAPIARAMTHIGTAGAALWGASFLTTMLREALFNSTTWQQKSEDGELWDWLADLSLQRTGVNGPLDPVIQAMTGLKYERDLSSLTAGAQLGYFLQAAGDIMKPFAGFGSPNTNTSEYNAIKGAYSLFMVPAAGIGLTLVPGPLGLPAGAAMQFVTGRGAADTVAQALVGPKGTGEGGVPPTQKPPGEGTATREAKGSGSGLLGGVPLGAVDDLAAPGVRAAMPLWRRLPAIGKAAAIGGAAVYTGSALANEFSRWKGQ